MKNQTNKKCRVCNNYFTQNHFNQKYCGKYYNKGDCAWKVSKLQTKLAVIKHRCSQDKDYKKKKTYYMMSIYNKWLENSMSFVLWAISSGWQDGLEIDRVDNNKGYSPNNCRFVTRKENCRNKKYKATDWILKKRKCRICHKVKKFDYFAISRKEVGGIAYECKLCRKEIDKKRWSKKGA